MNCFNEAVDNLNELIVARLARIKDIELELTALGKVIKGKLIQSSNEFQLNRHQSGKAYKFIANSSKSKAKSIYTEKKTLNDEIEKLRLVINKILVCEVKMEEEMKRLESEYNKTKQSGEVWRNRIVNNKFKGMAS